MMTVMTLFTVLYIITYFLELTYTLYKLFAIDIYVQKVSKID